jgi:hypothetical protein
MKISFDFKPRFVASRWLVPRGYTGITLLWWVFYREDYIDFTYDGPTRTPTDRFRRHETIHSWQQTVLFALGLAACVLTSLICGLFGAVTPWWAWTFPVLIPFVLYALAWLVELVLPPYDRAYMDSIFEREAYLNEEDPDYVSGVFSVWQYFRANRKFLERKRQ